MALRRGQKALRGGAVVLVAALAAAGLAGHASAQTTPADGLTPAAPTGPWPKLAERERVDPALLAADGTATAFVELSERSLVDVYAEQRRNRATPEQTAQAVRSTRERMNQQADRVVAALGSGGEELYRTGNALNGLMLSGKADKLAALGKLPEVRSVRRHLPTERMNASAAQLTKAVSAWKATGRLGDNMRIGIVDDGVDYTHADFGGPGTEAAYKAIDSTKVESSYFPTAKVVGGADLVGNDYDSSGRFGSRTPKPDPNPIACGQHGTHVAGTAAGFGVNADGSTFKGDYNTLGGEQLAAMRIGPGTAPKAKIYAYKVFGCKGGTSVVGKAMDLVLDPNSDGDFSDRLDVVNLSLGTDFGTSDTPENKIMKTLADHGVLVVAANGNGGDITDVGGSPANAPSTLAVANTRDAYSLRDGIEVTAPSTVAGRKAGQLSVEYGGYASLDLTRAVVPLSDETNKDGCKAFSDADKAKVADKIVWLEWDDDDATRKCGSAVRANNAEAAGAKAVLLPTTAFEFAAGIGGNKTTPMFQLTRQASEQVRPVLGQLSVRLRGSLRGSTPNVEPRITDTVTPSSSRGGRGPAVKPDVAAPGDTISSAKSGSGNDVLVIGGTSMATPHVAGIAALVRQAHPDWTPEEVKASVMNTATATINAAADKKVAEGPQRVGSGRVDALAAQQNQLLVMADDPSQAVSVSFGTVEVIDRVRATRTVKVVNKSDKPVSVAIDYVAATMMPGVRYEVTPSELDLGPKLTRTFTVTLRIDDARALRKVIDPTMQEKQGGKARQFVSDASGWLTVTPEGGAALRLPVYAAPKPVSQLAAQKLEVGAQRLVQFTGRGLDQGSGSQAYRSLASVFELHGSSPQMRECGGAVVDNCTINQTARGGDLRWYGANSNQQGLVTFGIATWGDWSSIGGNTVPFVDIDTTGDGRPDRRVEVGRQPQTDLLLAQTRDLTKRDPDGTFTIVEAQPVNTQYGDVDTNVYDSSVIALPTTLKALGIPAGATSAPLKYMVNVRGYYVAPSDSDGLVDTSGTPVSFDPLKPGVVIGSAPAVAHVARDRSTLQVKPGPGTIPKELLILHHHNGRGQRAGLIAM
ncbi:S8 family serine peptidase [Allokutzneria multivorans]|uniref:S8 family serine peptidase n=1 Tax=Allokutzneria multivorans TaxID=1142134 RepID=A0ABP7R956_9PSEU